MVFHNFRSVHCSHCLSRFLLKLKVPVQITFIYYLGKNLSSESLHPTLMSLFPFWTNIFIKNQYRERGLNFIYRFPSVLQITEIVKFNGGPLPPPSLSFRVRPVDLWTSLSFLHFFSIVICHDSGLQCRCVDGLTLSGVLTFCLLSLPHLRKYTVNYVTVTIIINTR